MTDTTQEASDVLHNSLRKISVREKIDLIKQINKDVESIALAGIKRVHPQYSRREISYELTRRRYGDALADMAFGSTKQ